MPLLSTLPCCPVRCPRSEHSRAGTRRLGRSRRACCAQHAKILQLVSSGEPSSGWSKRSTAAAPAHGSKVSAARSCQPADTRPQAAIAVDNKFWAQAGTDQSV